MKAGQGGLGRSFHWLNVTQFLGALNDNVFKLLVIFLLVEKLGESGRAGIVATASTVFVVPFLLFSHAAGVLADRVSKRQIVVWMKVAEAAIMALGCVAIWWGNPLALYAIIFLMCTQSTVFGPPKYGIIPELVPPDRLLAANSVLVGLTYLAIIIGTFIPSFLLLNVLGRSFLGLGLFCVGVAVAGTLASLRIAPTPAAGTDKRFSPWFFVEVFRTLHRVRRDRHLLLAILGSAYFLFLAAFLQQNLLIYGRDNLGLDWIQSGYLFPMAALGIGLGALLTSGLSGRNIEFGVVPLGALGLTLGCFLLAAGAASLPRALALILLIGVSSGLFTVPLNAFVQQRSPPGDRGELLACSNFMSFLGVALSAGLLVLLHEVLHLNAVQCFVVSGALTAVLAAGAMLVLPDFFVRFVVVVITRCFYRITVRGLQYVPVEGPALLVSNHVTWVDALLLSATQQRRIRFLMARDIHARRWMNPVFRLMGTIPISPQDGPREIVASFREARRALEEGYLVCIFAEGALTRNGNLQGFRPGFERIVRGLDCPVVPVCIAGAWGSIFSYYTGRLVSTLPRRLPYPVTVLFGAPLQAGGAMAARARLAVSELLGDAFDLKKNRGRCLPLRFVATARRYWFRPFLEDTGGRRVTFGEALAGALALREQLAPLTADRKAVGLLLPSSVGGALANLALSLAGRVPVNLNFTASAQALSSAIEQAGIRAVVTSRAFLEKLGTLEPPRGAVYLEDLKERIGRREKGRALVRALLLPARRLVPDAPGPDDTATIMFSSGSTGQPKGVMLSHHNILSNVEAFEMVFRLRGDDRMCCVLPFFHSFGFTVTLWTPAVVGFMAAYHPNPLDAATIATMVRERRLTILIATPTFLLAYIRKGAPEDFRTLRSVVVGAEKLKPRVADAFEQRFGIRPLEGYGTTELSPVVAVNLPDVSLRGVTQRGTKEGSIGHPIPGTAVRVVDLEEGHDLPAGAEGLLLVRGPNVMQGYLGQPAKTAEVLRDGWYDTGDVARVDEDGFVFLLDRLSRYSKIGGEMVPHLAVEDLLAKAAGKVGQWVAVTGVPDERKGEQLVVCYTAEAGEVEALRQAVADSELPNLWKPRRENYLKVEALPVLGTGKLDLRRLQELACEFVTRRPGVLQRAVDAVRRAI